jgi:filamentous hemagglutinin family protein
MNQPTLRNHLEKFHLGTYFILSKINIQEPLGLVKKILQWLALVPLASILIAEPVPAQQVQPVIPASDGTGTVVTPNGNQINITGGQLSRDNANLFHSFTQFGLNADQIANFLSTPGIQNILGRIAGGNPSVINGLLQVTGSNANLFLMNPAGIIFGPNASLNVPGAFTATTANGIGFGSNWFNASGTNNYANIVGNPGFFSFSMSQPGAILNVGNLTVGKGQDLTLLGGTVVNIGSVSAPEGQIILSAIPGEKLVRLSQPGSPLSLEIQPITASNSQAQNWNLPILSLPGLLTSGGGVNANILTVNGNEIALSGSGIPVTNGDVVAGNVTAKTALIAANRNLTGVESQLQTTGDLNLLAGNTVQIRDSATNPFVAKTGGNLFIQGNQGIDILALNHPEPAFVSTGNLSLVSDGVISGDAHFTSGGNFSILNLSGQPGIFTSLYDPIITVTGDYTIASYTGPALKVQAGGNITFGGGIRITGSDTNISGTPGVDTDEFLLQNFPALILRSQSGNINVSGNIDTSISGYGGGPVILSAPGNITAGNINTSSTIGNGGDISINTTGGTITVGNLTSTGTGTAGAVTLDAARDITTKVISSNGANKGDVNIVSSSGSININDVDSTGNSIVAKSITIDNPGTLNVLGGLNARSDGSNNAGNITIGDKLVPSSITVGTISTRNLAENSGDGGNINVTTTGSFNATKAFSRSTGQVVNPTEPDSVSIASEANSLSSGAIKINANGGITTVAGISSSSSSGTGGNITLTSNNGAINTNQSILDSSSQTGTGGLISLSSNTINTGNISSNGSNGGNVSLTAGNIEFASINTQGNGENGIGGNVSITANGVPNGTVKGTGTIPVPQVSAPPIPAGTTILSRGNQQSGTVNITHNGGAENVPFTVGNSTTNGTAGAIDAGASSRIASGSSFPVLPNGGNATGTPNGITIASVNSPPTVTVNQSLNNVQQDKPITFTYADLNPSVNDANGDRTSLQIDSITAGTLTKNGVAVVPGTSSAILSPGDNLEYTPPPGFSGNISPFSISAGDGVSFSAPQTIGFNVAATPPPPPPPPELPPKKQTDDLVRTEPPVTTPPIPIINANLPPKFDSAVEGIDDKFASQFESFLGGGLNNAPRSRRVSLYETRDILRQIEKDTGVRPAIIYVTFTPSGANEKALKSQQDSDQLDLVIVTAKGEGEPFHKTISTAKRKDVLNLAKNLYGSLEDPDENPEYLQHAQELYQLIVAPLKEELDKKGINNLLFITDEGLRSLPFAALHDGKQFLVENYSVGFTPALSITDTRYVDIRKSQVLAMGASKFEQLNPLPAVPQELSIVAKEIWQGKFFLNQNFTLNNLKSIRSSQPFGIIHLATHGEFNEGTTDDSFIQFWDSQLKLTQLGDLGLNNPAVELLVLSACRTAVGNREAELGFGGFAYKAGVKTAIASLWQVSDSGTLGLMTELYKNLKTAPIKAEALRQAQIAMIKGQVGIENGVLRTSVRGVSLPPESPEATQKKDLKHPYYWAAFTMIGSPW